MAADWSCGKLIVSGNGRFLQFENGHPFFWLGDTAWLLTIRSTREEAVRYLRDRKSKGFNLIQVMAIHTMPTQNAYGKQPFVDGDFTRPLTESGDEHGSYWDHLDYIVAAAYELGMFVAIVPVWGDVVVNRELLDAGAAAGYGRWIAGRYAHRPNVVWLNGGDIHGSRKTEVWQSLAAGIREGAPHHLMTFHPFGRAQSSTWFHQESWLDFNMFQSGHRDYEQYEDKEFAPFAWKGEDNWRYVQEDYLRLPLKPTLDGEPSYEGIPHGLHDRNKPLWSADDCRRYAYWSVFAGACGHTYGHNAVMQLHKEQYGVGAYGCTKPWEDALDDPGARQMIHLKNLMQSRPYFERIPDPTLIHGDPGFRYDHLLSTRGRDYLFVYTYTGRAFSLRMGVISGAAATGWWYNPRDGRAESIGEIRNSGIQAFDPPGEAGAGNDWVLVLDDASSGYDCPGSALAEA